MTILGGSSGFGPRGGDGKPPEVPVVTERDFEAKVLRSELPVLLEFFSARSAVSKQVATEVAAFAKDMTGKVAVYRVDADKSPIIVRQLRVQQIPTFMLFAEQRVADAQVGPLRKRDLQAMVEPFLPRQAGALKVPEVAQLLQKGAIAMVDTRDAGAFGRAHLPKATHIPLEEVKGRIAELYMLPGQPVLYCRSGDKTKELVAELAADGVEAAFMEGGLLAWEAEGLPIQRG
ncbi:MAG: thioredoxin [Polyangiaceae bacterium]|nr:thioredoxin [Polyangiaceae bacterium]